MHFYSPRLVSLYLLCCWAGLALLITSGPRGIGRLGPLGVALALMLVSVVLDIMRWKGLRGGPQDTVYFKATRFVFQSVMGKFFATIYLIVALSLSKYSCLSLLAVYSCYLAVKLYECLPRKEEQLVARLLAARPLRSEQRLYVLWHQRYSTLLGYSLLAALVGFIGWEKTSPSYLAIVLVCGMSFWTGLLFVPLVLAGWRVSKVVDSNCSS